ncbi:hypothetical protein [Burkholderia vietnamiensis]|uniref:hypothetical protein n=1 Tax=Burkholderia vietnamiensis TaxID=60552 RepID=UPI0012D85737|nr:hypothetical protein [Burkholderia vietnamiensis]
MPTDVEWAAARHRYETEPGVGLSAIAISLGISKGSAGNRAKAEGWRKCEQGTTPARDRGNEEAGKVAEGPESTSESAPGVYSPQPAPAIEVAVIADEHAQVVATHRQEARAVRGAVYRALKSKDPEDVRLAKLAAEAMQIVQNMERKAWGLDGEPNLGPGRARTMPGRITINRKPGGAIV